MDTYRAAQVMEGLQITPAEVASMTPAQIQRLCFHRRNKDGTLRAPAGAAMRPKGGAMPHVPDATTLDEALARLEKYHAEAAWVPDDEKRRAAERLRARWGKKGGA